MSQITQIKKKKIMIQHLITKGGHTTACVFSEFWEGKKKIDPMLETFFDLFPEIHSYLLVFKKPTNQPKDT